MSIYTMSEVAYVQLAREINDTSEKDVIDYINRSYGIKGTVTGIRRVPVEIKGEVKNKYENC